jgi:putative oxidoreductase
MLDWLLEPFGGAALGWGAHVEWALLPVRIAVGVIMFNSGWSKWTGDISGTGRWFGSLGFPAPQLLARWVATVEVVGGALLIVGLAAHVAAVFITVNMLVAAWVQKAKLGAPFKGGDVQGYELDLLLAAAAFTIVLGGAGPLSLDAVILG